MIHAGVLRNTRVRLLALAMTLAVVASVLVAPLSAAAQPNQFTNIPLEQQVNRGLTFQGTLDITEFVVQDGQLVALGTVTGELVNRAGRTVATITNQPVSLPVNVTQQGECEVLFLQLGPLELRLLGLNVNIDQITIEITADPAGGLLGQLLCALAGGPNGGLIDLQLVADLLNDLLGGLSA
jgi:hypothetical protein